RPARLAAPRPRARADRGDRLAAGALRQAGAEAPMISRTSRPSRCRYARSSVHRISWSRAARVLHFSPMPIYEFVCESCGRIVERLQKLTDPPPEACPECGGKMAKIMSRNSFQLKGGGWYRDLYGSSGSGSSASGDGKAAPK